MHESLPTCAVVIPVRNGAATLGRCLAALDTQAGEDVEIIVVDDGSTDGTRDVARGFGVRILSYEPAGPAAARNRGVLATHAPIVLFTDADCVPTPGWLARMVDAFDDPAISGCKGAYVSSQQSLVARLVQLDYEDRYRRMKAHGPIDFIDTYSAGYRRRVLLDSGGFDEHFLTASVEDQELSFRISGQGHRLAFVPDARVQHTHPETLQAYVRKKVKIGYYKPQLHVRHIRRIAGDSHTPTILRVQTLNAAVLLCLCPATTFWRPARLAMSILLATLALSAVPQTIRNGRKDILAGVTTPGFAMIRALSLATGLAFGVARMAVLFARPATRLTKLFHTDQSIATLGGIYPDEPCALRATRRESAPRNG